MEKSKIKIKPPSSSGIRISNPQFDKMTKEANRRNVPGMQKNKKFKGRIKPLIAAGLIGWGMAGGIVACNNLNLQEQKYSIAKVSSNEKNEAVINVSGDTYRLDESSFALVYGEIQDGENFAYAFDKNGNIMEGTVDGEFLTEILVMSEQQLSKYDMIYQVTPEEGASVRTSASAGLDNVSYTANYGDYVLGTTTTSGNEWIGVLGTNGEDVFQGYIDEEHLELVSSISDKEYLKHYGENARTVNTSEAEYNNLHLRKSPDMGGNVLTTIPHGSVVKVIGETVTNDSREWTEVEYRDTTGTKLKGWAVTEYLKQFEREEQEQQESMQNIAINASGNVTGIDISGMSPEYLRELLQKGIPESITTQAYGKTDVTQMAGNINFVFIKLGKSGYRKGELKLTDYTGYEEQVKVCEELGVPYGFYYYSTSINEKEAQKEADYIIQAIEELRGKYDLKHNIMPPVIDVELTNENDRQYGHDISDAKAYMINRIQEEGISENVLIYAPGRVMDPEDSDRLIDLERINEKISNPDNLAIWLCAPTKSNGEDTSKTQKYYDLIENQFGVNVVNRQMALDATVESEKRYDKLMDVNNMEMGYFTKLLEENERKQAQKLNPTSTENHVYELIEKAQDDER